ncbi:MAG: UbiA family prenyltransferase [Planctomycetota bacterium]
MTDRPPLSLSILRLFRIGAWFSPAADVLAGAAIMQVALGVPVARAMLASTLVYGAGMVWNDVADRRLDAVQRPERPLPSGHVSLGLAVALGLALLAGGLWASPCRVHHSWIAAFVLVYDFLGKRVEWLGALNMGALRAMNLGTGLALAAGEGAVTDEARRALLLAALCYGIYIVAVTVLGIFEDARSVPGRAIATVQAAPPIVAFAGVAVVQGGWWPATVIAALPCLWFLRRNAKTREWPQARIRESMTFLLLGTMLYTALLTLAAGRWPEALGITVTIPLARRIARSISLT